MPKFMADIPGVRHSPLEKNDKAYEKPEEVLVQEVVHPPFLSSEASAPLTTKSAEKEIIEYMQQRHPLRPDR